MYAVLLLAGLAFSPSTPAAPPQYGVIKRIPISGEGGWDYLAMDPDTHRLFISRGTHEMVLDVESGQIVGDIPNTPGVHGVALVPKANKGYSSNGRDNTVTVFDLKTLKELSRIKVGERPDAIFYDSASNRVFTFNAGSVDTTAIDVRTDTVAGSVKLAGKPEFPRVDGKGSLFVNIEDASTIQKVDTKDLKVTGSWSIAPADGPSGLAIDTKDHLLFSVCGNNMMAISDYVAGKVVATPKIGNGPDAAEFDPGTGLAFSSNGQDGTLSIVGRTPSGAWDVVQTVETQKSARTMTLDPKTHRIYLIAAEFKAPAAGQRRGSVVPGSTVIVVVGPTR